MELTTDRETVTLTVPKRYRLGGVAEDFDDARTVLGEHLASIDSYTDPRRSESRPRADGRAHDKNYV